MNYIYMCFLLICIFFTIIITLKIRTEEKFYEFLNEVNFEQYKLSDIKKHLNIETNRLKTIPLVISINVFEKPHFLLKQLDNIRKYVKIDYIIILNCNDYMLNVLHQYNLPSNVHVNPVFINKRRYHGSLLEGIISNMKMSLSNYEFKYFLILSSRTFFYNYILDESEFKKHIFRNHLKLNKKENFTHRKWKYTKLYEYVLKNRLYFSTSRHEGLCFDYETCFKLLWFFEINPYIFDNLITFAYCVEEFGLQTICSNLNLPYFNINNDQKSKQCDIYKLTNQIIRK